MTPAGFFLSRCNPHLPFPSIRGAERIDCYVFESPAIPALTWRNSPQTQQIMTRSELEVVLQTTCANDWKGEFSITGEGLARGNEVFGITSCFAQVGKLLLWKSLPSNLVKTMTGATIIDGPIRPSLMDPCGPEATYACPTTTSVPSGQARCDLCIAFQLELLAAEKF
jgi:hypothetical protein